MRNMPGTADQEYADILINPWRVDGLDSEKQAFLAIANLSCIWLVVREVAGLQGGLRLHQCGVAPFQQTVQPILSVLVSAEFLGRASELPIIGDIGLEAMHVVKQRLSPFGVACEPDLRLERNHMRITSGVTAGISGSWEQDLRPADPDFRLIMLPDNLDSCQQMLRCSTPSLPCRKPT